MSVISVALVLTFARIESMYIYIYICIRVLHICICIPVFGLVWICMYTYPYVMIYIVGVFGVSPSSVCVVTARLIKVS